MKDLKTIETSIIITGVRSKVDGSLGLSMTTPELSPEEKAEFMRLQNMNLIALFTPIDEKDAPKLMIDKELNSKSPSTRLRNALFVLWQQNGSKDDFEIFYKRSIEKFIDIVKERLN